ncbi:stage II sporulation protein M [Paraliobacillus sp. JSM ZJ581]|uniref:stage II sporulation protein M n=1 Tax=Paraliobacillus sp. JSM ZJ581 TaxID=3342118 RepID=UPI0035A9A2F9
MQLKTFIQQHRSEWMALEASIYTLRKRNSMNQTNINEFEYLYQKTTQHLSYSQTYFPNDEVTRYLNELVAKAHNLLYQTERSSWKQMQHFLSTKFIGLLLDQWQAIVIAMLLFTLGAIASFLAVIENPLHIYKILPSDMVQNIADPSQLEANQNAGNAPLMSAQIMTNNIRVAILAFVGGITFGILTLYVLIYNGILIGALAGYFWNADSSYIFWAYIVPHGMIELTAIFIVGGAGLLMGYRLFVPKNFSRVYHLKVQAVRSVQLLLGTIPLFIVAGLIEGYITPADLSLEIKYTVAITSVVAMIAYMLIGYHLLQKKTRAPLYSADQYSRK